MAAGRRVRRLPKKAEIQSLFKRVRTGRDSSARDALVLAYQNLAIYLARKFAGRGEQLDDIIQVAHIGLLKAIDRYDASRGIEFSTYATPTILGEIKRHFRDKLWSVHVPRRLREVNYALMRALEDLSQRLGRSPTIPELAQAVGVSFEEVLQALEVGRAYNPISLEAEAVEGETDRAGSLLESLGDEDRALKKLEDRASLEWALGHLPERLRQIVRLRFFEDLPQVEIARRLGLSQMHVSRMLREALIRLRALISGRRPVRTR
jgi:RNA polymerase sigma-B factor